MLLYVDDLDRLGTKDEKAVEVRLGHRAGARQGIDPAILVRLLRSQVFHVRPGRS